MVTLNRKTHITSDVSAMCPPAKHALMAISHIGHISRFVSYWRFLYIYILLLFLIKKRGVYVLSVQASLYWGLDGGRFVDTCCLCCYMCPLLLGVTEQTGRN